MFANYNQTALERMQELIEQLHRRISPTIGMMPP